MSSCFCQQQACVYHTVKCCASFMCLLLLGSNAFHSVMNISHLRCLGHFSLCCWPSPSFLVQVESITASRGRRSSIRPHLERQAWRGH